MKHKNIGKRMLCLLLVVCSILTSIGFNRVEARAKVDEKKLYMDYMAKVDKKWRKKIKQLNSKEKYNEWEPRVSYKIIDLDGDGRKELVYLLEKLGAWTPIMQWYVCTVKKGKVHKVLKSDPGTCLMLHRIKGEKKKVVLGSWYAPTKGFTVYTFSSGKMKKEGLYSYGMEIGSTVDYFHDVNGKRIEDPFRIEDLKAIDVKEYK